MKKSENYKVKWAILSPIKSLKPTITFTTKITEFKKDKN